MPEDRWLHLAGLAVLFILSAFFSASETALMGLDRLRVKHLVQKKRRGAERIEALLEQPDRLLSGILVGNNAVNIALSVFATTFLVELYGPRGEVLTILILTPLLLILAEITPKTYAAQNAEKVSFAVLRPILAVLTLLSPVIWLVTSISGCLTRLMGKRQERPLISEEEIRSIISVGGQTGAVPKEQQRMLHGIFELSQTRVRDIMILRTEMVALDVNSPFPEVLHKVQEARHSRFPVIEGSVDNVVGIVHSKDILKCVEQPDTFSLRQLARPPYFVPESKRIGTLLQSFRQKRIHLAIVIDEYGGVEGIVTLEDIVEEIVGEIRDEYDAEEVLFREIAPGRFLVDGSASLKTVNRRFGLQLSEEHANTLAGFLLRTMGNIPLVGESCESDGTIFIVRRVVDRRIEEIEMVLASPPAP